MRQYVNGELYSTKAINQVVCINSNFEFGRDPNIGRYFYGNLDDIGIWNRALSAAEISSLYNPCDISIATNPLSTATFGGHTSTLTVAATSSSPLTYHWQRKVGADFVNVSDGADYSGSSTETLTIKSSRISIKGPYRCVVSASEGCSATSNEATLTVECPCDAP